MISHKHVILPLSQNLILSIETLLKVTMSVLSPLEFALAYDGLVLCAKGHGS